MSIQHKQRKAAALRKEAAKYKDGNGKYRVELSRAKAKLNKGLKGLKGK